MVEGKDKAVKITEREIVKAELARLLKENGANLLGATKEGLVLEVNGKHVVVRTILKKENIAKRSILAVE
jgi:hypothetical protein